MIGRSFNASVVALSAFLGLGLPNASATPTNLPKKAPANIQKLLPADRYRGWSYIVGKLKELGVPDPELLAVYGNPQFPLFSFVPFGVAPREPFSMYSEFITPANVIFAAQFCRRHSSTFDQVEKVLKVPRQIVAAILLVESQLGRNTGKEMIVYRLSRLATVNEPNNVQRNFVRLQKDDPNVSLEAVQKRAEYLERVFIRELPALFSIGRRNKVNLLNIKGSIAGAFGLPQFLPSAFLQYGYDGDKDGVVSLFNEVDAIWSAANYLSHSGYRPGMSRQEVAQVIWKYNHSEAYVETIINFAEEVEKEI